MITYFKSLITYVITILCISFVDGYGTSTSGVSGKGFESMAILYVILSLQSLFSYVDAQFMQKLVATDGAGNDYFGISVSTHNDYTLIGTRFDDDGGSNSGSAYIYERINGEWTETAKLVADDAQSNMYFGTSVSIHNDYGLIGAYYDDDNGAGSGSAYIYERTDGLWIQKVKLLPDDAAANDCFGYSVSIHDTYALIGARYDDDKGSASGAAYVYERIDGEWLEFAKLTPEDGAADDQFGYSVSVYGNVSLIGALYTDAMGYNSGAAYVFQRNNGAWNQTAKLTAEDGASKDYFGTSVSLYEQYALIGAQGSDSAYVFENIDNTWNEAAKLVPDDDSTGDRFGRSVSIYNQTAVIGAYRDDDKGSNAGAAYIYKRINGNWTQGDKLTADDGEDNDSFGYSVSISDKYVSVGSYGDDNDGGIDAGAAYIGYIATGTCEEPANFVWEDLMEREIGKPTFISNLSVDDATLTLNIAVDVDYLGATAADNNGYVYGTTYVIDFEDYDAHSDNIREAGSCQNRDKDLDILATASWDALWNYSVTPNVADHVGSNSYLAYPPGGLWSVQMSPDDACRVRYTVSLTWDELMACSNYDGTQQYITAVDAEDNITLSGTLYINVVSPFADNGDYSFYRVFQLLSQPFQIVLSKTVYVMDSTGINLLTVDIIAVYKEDSENIFKLIVLTESAEYLELSRTGLGDMVGFNPETSTGLVSSDFRFLETTESSGCLQSKTYICSQIWQITAENAKCSSSGNKYTDFSGIYSMQFEAKCRDDLGNEELDAYCDQWLQDHESEIVDAATEKVLLSVDLTWTDTICDPIVFEIQFTANMQFFEDSAFVNIASDTYLYQVGQDTVYVEVTTDYSEHHFSVFETELVNVWICTFDPLLSPRDIEEGQMVGGCFSNTTDLNVFDGHNGHIYRSADGLSLEEFALDTQSATESNVVRFEFIIPTQVKRDKLYVHAQIEVSLSANGTRRRVLMDVDMNMMKKANQMDHFVDEVSITQTPIEHYHPQQPQNPPQTPPNPQQPFIVSLQSQWMIVIACLVAVVLIFNIIFMCYISYHKHRDYALIKSQDSEFDLSSNSECDVINVVSD